MVNENTGHPISNLLIILHNSGLKFKSYLYCVQEMLFIPGMKNMPGDKHAKEKTTSSEGQPPGCFTE
jgi:hypothetical protein